jgi:hypothetical protein
MPESAILAATARAGQHNNIYISRIVLREARRNRAIKLASFEAFAYLSDEIAFFYFPFLLFYRAQRMVKTNQHGLSKSGETFHRV